jgi:hypothetical protein
MGYFALIKDNTVKTVIVANREFIEKTPIAALQADLAVEVFENRPSTGYVYDPDTGTFTPPTE